MLKAEIRTNYLKLHLWSLPRWFAAPYFGASAILGALTVGGMTLNSWLGLLASLLVMAGGHSFNSFLDYAWTGLDKGKIEDRSAEKDYTGGQSLLARGLLSLKSVFINALGWYFLAALVIAYLALRVGWQVIVIGILGMLVTFWYSKAKFNWTHELALAVGVGPLPALMGIYSTSPHPSWAPGVLASLPASLLLSFTGLAVDEWPDAEANLKKGVKSIAYKVWEYNIPLEWYVSSWIIFTFIYQIMLVVLGIYKPLTGITFFTWPLFLACIVFLKKYFNKATNILILVGGVYLFLLIVGQVSG